MGKQRPSERVTFLLLMALGGCTTALTLTMENRGPSPVTLDGLCGDARYQATLASGRRCAWLSTANACLLAITGDGAGSPAGRAQRLPSRLRLLAYRPASRAGLDAAFRQWTGGGYRPEREDRRQRLALAAPLGRAAVDPVAAGAADDHGHALAVPRLIATIQKCGHGCGAR